MTFFPSSPLNGTNFMSDLSAICADLSGQAMPGTYRNIVGANGGFEIWQRGAGATTPLSSTGVGASISVAANTAAYTADRWYLNAGANEASVVSQVAGLTSGSRYAARVRRTDGQTGVTAMTFGYPLDADEIARIIGQTCILSFVLSTGSGFSATTAPQMIAYLATGSGTSLIKQISGFTSQSTPIAYQINPGASSPATPYASPVSSSAIAATTLQAEVLFSWSPTGTASSDFFTVDDVQLHVVTSNLSGGVVPLFERTSFKSDYDRCLRFYRKSFSYGTAPGQNVTSTGAMEFYVFAAAVNLGRDIDFSPPMRVTPSITFYNPGAANANWYDITVSTDSGQTCSPGRQTEKGTFAYQSTGTASSGHDYAIHYQADASI